MPDLSWVRAGERLARLAGRGPPEGSGKEGRLEHATALPPGKRGESPSSDKERVAWFINSWRSDGALLGEALPRVKVGAPGARVAKRPGADRIPARHKSKMAGATRAAMAPWRGGSFPTLADPAPTKSTKGSRAAGNWRGRTTKKTRAAIPLTSPERHDHEANCSAPQADRATMPLARRNQYISCRLASNMLRVRA
jgi:hypothetical protein